MRFFGKITGAGTEFKKSTNKPQSPQEQSVPKLDAHVQPSKSTNN